MPGTTTTPPTAPKATTGVTPRVLTNEGPLPGQIGLPIAMTGCVKRIERLDTDNASVADVINRPMTAYVLEPSGGEVDEERRVTGLISANGGVRLDAVVGKAVVVSGTMRPPMAIGSPPKGADSPEMTELQPMIVRSLKAASVQCR